MITISPSILSADFSNLEQEIKALEQAGADMIHIEPYIRTTSNKIFKKTHYSTI